MNTVAPCSSKTPLHPHTHTHTHTRLQSESVLKADVCKEMGGGAGALPTGSDVLTSDFRAEPDSTLWHLANILTSVFATTLNLSLEAGQSLGDKFP
jgi:hypothetical protein